VVDAVNAIIKDGRIKVVYVPGNHDVDFSAAMAEAIFPGIFQARDSEGVGTYRTGVKQEVAIEHGHRYNVFCAPDPLTDTTLRAGKTLIGPGYFYTRIAATSLKSGHHPRSFAFPDFGVAAADIPTASAEIQKRLSALSSLEWGHLHDWGRWHDIREQEHPLRNCFLC
jgi:hypothetical protein